MTLGVSTVWTAEIGGTLGSCQSRHWCRRQNFPFLPFYRTGVGLRRAGAKAGDIWGEHVAESGANWWHCWAFWRRAALLLTSERDCECGMYVDGRSPRLKRGRSCEGYATQLHKGQRSFQLNQTSKQWVNLPPLKPPVGKAKTLFTQYQNFDGKIFCNFQIHL